MTSVNQKLWKIGQLAEQLPPDKQRLFYQQSYLFLIQGKVNGFQFDRIKSIYEMLEKESR